MAVSHQGVFVQTPKITPQTFVNADGTNLKTIATAGADGSKVVAVNVSTTDTANRIFQLWLTRGGTDYLICAVSIPLTSGSTGSLPAINILSNSLLPSLPVDNDGQKYLYLESGDTLRGSFTAAITAATTAYVVAVFGNF